MNIQPYHGDNLLPLTPQTFHILLAISQRPLNGYAIAQQCGYDSEQLVTISATATYKALKRLTALGFVAPEADGQPGPQRYQITLFGFDLLRAETKRLSAAVGLAQSRSNGYTRSQ
jgi:DNA-binding PadR family transcriptional regulator